MEILEIGAQDLGPGHADQKPKEAAASARRMYKILDPDGDNAVQ